MKKLATIVAALALMFVVVWVLLPRFRSGSGNTTAYTTTVQLSGTTNASFSGHYVRDGKRITISGVLPWSLSESNLLRFEVRKAKLEDTLVVDAHGGGSMLTGTAGPGSRGLRVEMENGWSFELIK